MALRESVGSVLTWALARTHLLILRLMILPRLPMHRWQVATRGQAGSLPTAHVHAALNFERDDGLFLAAGPQSAHTESNCKGHQWPMLRAQLSQDLSSSLSVVIDVFLSEFAISPSSKPASRRFDE